MVDVWLDCDPGHDDAFAMILAAHSPALHLLGISTVAGNVSIEKTTKNALHILAAFGDHHTIVVQGQSKPLTRGATFCPEIHGDSGLDGVTFPPLPEGVRATEGKAVNVMFEHISAAHGQRHEQGQGQGQGQQQGRGPGTVVLVATGALTNVALLLSVYPEVVQCLRDIVIMGGAIGMGNTSPAAEFNIEIDPEAAHIVFSSGLVTMVPLEVTHTALATPSVIARIKSLGTPFAHNLTRLLLHFQSAYEAVFGTKSPPLHDPCAVAYVISPHLFRTQAMAVQIETSSQLCAGRTVCDVHNRWKREANSTVCLSMDVAGFWDLMITACAAANQRAVAL